MDVKEYCDNMWVQLTVWKEELFDVVKIAENFPDHDKKVIAPELRNLLKLIDDLGKKIDQFKKECVVDSKSKKKHWLREFKEQFIGLL